MNFRCKPGEQKHPMKTGKIQVKRRRKSGVRNAIVEAPIINRRKPGKNRCRPGEQNVH